MAIKVHPDSFHKKLDWKRNKKVHIFIIVSIFLRQINTDYKKANTKLCWRGWRLEKCKWTAELEDDKNFYDWTKNMGNVRVVVS